MVVGHQKMEKNNLEGASPHFFYFTPDYISQKVRSLFLSFLAVILWHFLILHFFLFL